MKKQNIRLERMYSTNRGDNMRIIFSLIVRLIHRESLIGSKMASIHGIYEATVPTQLRNSRNVSHESRIEE